MSNTLVSQYSHYTSSQALLSLCIIIRLGDLITRRQLRRTDIHTWVFQVSRLHL